MTESIDERLEKLARDFDKLLIKSRLLKDSSHITETTQSDLVRFLGLHQTKLKTGLTVNPILFHPTNFYKVTKIVETDEELTESWHLTLLRYLSWHHFLRKTFSVTFDFRRLCA